MGDSKFSVEFQIGQTELEKIFKLLIGTRIRELIVKFVVVNL